MSLLKLWSHNSTWFSSITWFYLLLQLLHNN
jgi:hypothetical protein